MPDFSRPPHLIAFLCLVATVLVGCDAGTPDPPKKASLSTFEGTRLQDGDEQPVLGTATFMKANGDLQVELYLTEARQDGASLILRIRPAPGTGRSIQYAADNHSAWAVYFPGGACSIPFFLERNPTDQISLTYTESGVVTGVFALEVSRNDIFVQPPPFFCEGDVPSFQRSEPDIRFSGEFVASARPEPEIPIDFFSTLLTGSPDSPTFP